MKHDHRKCEDEDDAARMAEAILRELGYTSLQRGPNAYDVADSLGPGARRIVAVYAERIARWARGKETC